MTTPALTRSDRARGLLLAAGVGDAMGAPFEGQAVVEEAGLLAEQRAPSRLVHTDDTALMLVLAEHLAGIPPDRARQSPLLKWPQPASRKESTPGAAPRPPAAQAAP